MGLVVAFLVIVAAFVVVGVVGWAAWLIISTAITGLIIGGLARLVIPGRQPIGAIATVLCGWSGALIGTAIGHGFGIGHFFTILVEVGVATIVVAIWSASASHRRPVASTGGHRIIDI